MSFEDDVIAARAAKTQREAAARDLATSKRALEAAFDAEAADLATRKRALEAAFEAEVKVLWRSAEQYWRDNVKHIDAKAARYIMEGGVWDPYPTPGETVPFPILKMLVCTWPRTKEAWQSGALTKAESVIGFEIEGWFALIAPGLVKEMPNHPGAQTHWQVPRPEAIDLPGKTEPAFQMCFKGPSGKPDVLLRREVDGPTEVYTRTGGVWEHAGTLGRVVASALLDLVEARNQ